MDADTKIALEKSIAHWDEHTRAETCPKKTEISSENCALCDTFGYSCENEHGKCLVLMRTGYGWCKYSPWIRAFSAREQWERLQYTNNFETWAARAAFRKAARAERDFLISLREVGND